MGFNVLFSGLTCGFMPLSTPFTSGKLKLLDLDCDQVCTKYLSSVLTLHMLLYLSCSMFLILKDIGMTS